MLSLDQYKLSNTFRSLEKKRSKQDYRILIVQRFPKPDYILIDYYNSLGLLPGNFTSPSNQAHSYNQLVSMFKTVSFGWFLGFIVDYYLYHPDFGLIPVDNIQRGNNKENFKNIVKSRKFQSTHDKKILKDESLKKLKHYDLIYLDIPEEQLLFLNQSILRTKASEIVCFVTNTYISPPFLGFDVKDLKYKFINRSFLPIPITKQFKIGLLANYIMIKSFFPQYSFLKFIQVLQEYSLNN